MLSGDFIGTDITVTGDADRIEQIISNLLSNAINLQNPVLLDSLPYSETIF